jgi:hypothetical protein
MSVHYTSIGPFTTTLHFEGERFEAQIVAFGWEDADPAHATGLWVFGPTVKDGLAFLPIDAITIDDH